MQWFQIWCYGSKTHVRKENNCPLHSQLIATFTDVGQITVQIWKNLVNGNPERITVKDLQHWYCVHTRMKQYNEHTRNKQKLSTLGWIRGHQLQWNIAHHIQLVLFHSNIISIADLARLQCRMQRRHQYTHKHMNCTIYRLFTLHYTQLPPFFRTQKQQAVTS